MALTAEVGIECFGKNSFWARLLAADGMICNLNFDAGSTFIHYVERCLDVPYRFDKTFEGVFLEGGPPRQGRAIYFCRHLEDAKAEPAFEPFHRLAMAFGKAQVASVGRGSVTGIRARAVFDLIAQILPSRPWLLTKADGDGVNYE